ncbi:MAG: hypothetical protein AB9869_23940 [Verrucomicrobiia bacterium]
MSPREIEVHIEELVLHRFGRRTRWEVAEAFERELRGLLIEQGIPAAWQTSQERIETGAIQPGPSAKAGTAGEQIARAIYGGQAR